MREELDNISQITIHLKDPHLSARVSEVFDYKYFAKKNPNAYEREQLNLRKWNFRPLLNIKTFVFHHLKIFVPEARVTPEAEFKTVIATLLADESLRKFFLGTSERQRSFFKALKNGAETAQVTFIAPQKVGSSWEVAKELTLLSNQKRSLIENPAELNLQIAALPHERRNEILFSILNSIERPPLNSIVEIEAYTGISEIRLLTRYAKVQVYRIDEKSGHIDFSFENDKATSSIETMSNISEESKGVMNQHMVLEKNESDQRLIGLYCGHLLNRHHILEQLLFLLQEEEALNAYLIDYEPTNLIEDKTILFTSLFSWKEYEKIIREHNAVDALQGKVLKIVHKDGSIRLLHLNLLHQNLPFNTWNMLPTPSEIKANLNDINDEMLIQILPTLWRFLSLNRWEELENLSLAIKAHRRKEDFIARRHGILEEIDKFRSLKKEIAQRLDAKDHEAAIAAHALLIGKNPMGSKLQQRDAFIFTGVLTKHLGILRNTNCEHGTTRCFRAGDADKAQNAFTKIQGKAFLPGIATKEEEALFKILYSIYQASEEAEWSVSARAGLYSRNLH